MRAERNAARGTDDRVLETAKDLKNRAEAILSTSEPDQGLYVYKSIVGDAADKLPLRRYSK